MDIKSQLQNQTNGSIGKSIDETNRIAQDGTTSSLDKFLFNFGDNDPVVSKVRKIPLGKISPNPYQPRKYFDNKDLQELADDIKQHGLIQKIIVIPEVNEEFLQVQDKYILIAGERRYRAVKLLHEQFPDESKYNSVDSIIEIIIGLTPETYKYKLALLALSENLKRSDLCFVDFAESIVNIKKEFSLTFDELGKKLGKSADYLKLISSVYGRMSDDQRQKAREENLGRDAIEKMLAAANINESKKKSLSGDFDRKFFTDFKRKKTLEYTFDEKVSKLEEIVRDYFAKDIEESNKLLSELNKKVIS